MLHPVAYAQASCRRAGHRSLHLARPLPGIELEAARQMGSGQAVPPGRARSRVAAAEILPLRGSATLFNRPQLPASSR